MLKSGPEWAVENRRAEIAERLLMKFLEAWNMGEEPNTKDVEEARKIQFRRENSGNT